MKLIARVHCPVHGLIDLDDDEFTRQLVAIDSVWKCPQCGERADFDDAYFDAQFENQET